MPQKNFTIPNQSFPNFRNDLNSNLQALGSNSSGSTAPLPTGTQPAQFWADTSTVNRMKIRDTASSTTWYDLFLLNKQWGGFEASPPGADGWFTFPNGVMVQWKRQSFSYSANANQFATYGVELVYTFSQIYQAVATMNTGLDTGMVMGVVSLAPKFVDVSIAYPVIKSNFPITVTVFAIGTR